MRRITLLTDFGTADGYVAAMKGVLACMAPGVSLDDVSHEVARGDPRAASLVLERYWRLYPEGTVHVVVVDPGVGTDRRPLALRAEGRFVVAPDNGVVSRVMDGAETWRAVVIDRAGTPGLPEPSTTFDGRDVFAPAAARLARGTPLVELGPPLESPVRLRMPDPVRRGREVRGEVIAVDRFGNLVTNLPGDGLEGPFRVEVAGRRVEVARSYGHVEPGTLLAVVNSDGRVEVAVRDGSAAERLEIGRAAPVSALPASAGRPPRDSHGSSGGPEASRPPSPPGGSGRP